MTLLSTLDRTKPAHIMVTSIILLALNVLVNISSLPAETLLIFNSGFELVISGMVFIFFLLLYSVSKKNHFSFSRTIFWMGLTMLAWTLGDAIYFYMISVNLDPFISLSDFFYIGATLLTIISVLTIPGSQPPSQRQNMVFIEITILVLSATVISMILLLMPGIANLNFDPLTLLMVFIYPVLDIILIWIIMILFFSYPLKSKQKVIGILFAAAFCIFLSDMVYLVNNLYGDFINDYIVDLGYCFFYVLLLLAGFTGFKEFREPVPEMEKKRSAFNSGNWIVFLPGVFLIIIIGLLLVFVLNQSIVLNHGIIILIALIVILFIIHQYLVIVDNIKLTKEMRLINAQLESKVEQRTAELSNANSELQDEMKERGKVEEQLERNNKELALLNRDKDTLFTILAHDLRSPLGSMMKLSELLAESFKDFDENELHEVIMALNKSAIQTFQLLNDLLAWSTIQMGSGEGKKEIFPVFEALSENIDIFTSDATSKNIRIKLDIDPAIMVFADKFAIQTVLRNLVNNAVKFTPLDGTIKVKAEKSDKLVTISVIDNGVGISKEKQKKIFRIDSISSSPGTGGEKGTGFGLLLCKDLIQKNGGEIGLRSEKGKGSSFFFTLPVYEAGTVIISHPSKVTAGRIELKYDHSRKIGFSTFLGEFDQEVMKSELNQIWSSPDYKSDYSLLIDIRQASFKIEIKDYQEILGIFSDLPGKQTSKRFALLTTTPQHVAYSTIFSQHMKAKFPLMVEVFSTYEGAESWLSGQTFS